MTLAKHGVDVDYSGRDKPLIQYWDEPKVAKREKVNFGEGDVRNSSMHCHLQLTMSTLFNIFCLLIQIISHLMSEVEYVVHMPTHVSPEVFISEYVMHCQTHFEHFDHTDNYDLQDKHISNQILLGLQIMENNQNKKAQTDEFVYFKPLKDGQRDIEQVLEQVLKNQQRIMMALEVNSY